MASRGGWRVCLQLVEEAARPGGEGSLLLLSAVQQIEGRRTYVERVGFAAPSEMARYRSLSRPA